MVLVLEHGIIGLEFANIPKYDLHLFIKLFHPTLLHYHLFPELSLTLPLHPGNLLLFSSNYQLNLLLQLKHSFLQSFLLNQFFLIRRYLLLLNLQQVVARLQRRQLLWQRNRLFVQLLTFLLCQYPLLLALAVQQFLLLELCTEWGYLTRQWTRLCCFIQHSLLHLPQFSQPFQFSRILAHLFPQSLHTAFICHAF